jgi:CRISPR-associated endonuclease/helicase Cas3
MLSAQDFAAFFKEVHGPDPFPWQGQLLAQVSETGVWPSVLDLPTGSGKTAAIDIALFHLALEADRGEARRAPIRIAFVVDRRLVVDDAFTRAQTLAQALANPPGPISSRVADRLKQVANSDLALVARRLRGGIPREDDWARTPSQPTVLCSTVDQVGSRLLFRGYGVSDSMKPVHAGLIGSDCLVLLDEAHLAEPFRQTLAWIRTYKGERWRESNVTAPWGFALLTATLGETTANSFELDDKDKVHPVLQQRMASRKPARLIAPAKTAVEVADGDETEKRDEDLMVGVAAIVKEVRNAFAHFSSPLNGATAPAIGVVVNRVARARGVFEQLRSESRDNPLEGTPLEPILLIGPSRPLDRDKLADLLRPIRTRTWKEGESRRLEAPLVVVATQCIEAGVDIDLDALVTEAAPLDALRQRFGRLNRAGRPITPYAAILIAKSDLGRHADDPVYGQAIKTAWGCLVEAARKEGDEQIVDFGINDFTIRLDRNALSPKADAPILLPAHLDLLSQTSPIPNADPEIALFLHGPDRQPDSISVVWRADIDPGRDSDDDTVRRLLLLVPPRSGEIIELPLWAVCGWLGKKRRLLRHLADSAVVAPEEKDRQRRSRERGPVFRWRGNDERSRWIRSTELQPGDVVVVPARYGGLDEFGWNPDYEEPAIDIGRDAIRPFAGRRFVVRVAPGLLGNFCSEEALADALANRISDQWADVRDALLNLDLPQGILDDLRALNEARRKRSVKVYLDLYGMDEDRPRGVVFMAPFGIEGQDKDEDGRPNSTEDDASGSIPGFPQPLQEHSHEVEDQAREFAISAGLPTDRVADLGLAGFLHDAGKADARFQAWLSYGDPLGPDIDKPESVLAKSGRSLPSVARSAAGLPPNWRHEALSVRLAPHVVRFTEANGRDHELVLWLIGSHHGHGRPLFPHADPKDGESRDLPPVLGLPAKLPPGIGPQSLDYDWNGLDWAALFRQLKARYGIWELARMEAILRLADHRASEKAANRGESE